jgi:hypothetical protein
MAGRSHSGWPMLGPGVFASARVCGMLAGPLAQMLHRFRVEDGGTPDAELTAYVEAVVRLARAARSADGTSGIPAEDADATLGAVSVSTAAKVLGRSERAVRARLERGSLAGRKVNGTWLVWLPEEAA